MPKCLLKLLQLVSKHFGSCTPQRQHESPSDRGLNQAQIAQTPIDAEVSLETTESMLPRPTTTIRKRGFGNRRFMLENGDHHHFLRLPPSKRQFLKKNRNTSWISFKKRTKACSQPSADLEWEQWTASQQTGIVAVENMAILAQKYGDICDIMIAQLAW